MKREQKLQRKLHGLYEDIAEVITSVVPEFEEILDKLKVEEKITALKGKTADVPEIKLGDCQVIVKIASAEVNSENPVFNEGSWHLEGVEAEKIIATCIYYYDVKNVEKTFLRFRTTVGRDVYDLHYPQNCHDYVEYHYGMKLTSKDYMEGAVLPKFTLKQLQYTSLMIDLFCQNKTGKEEKLLPENERKGSCFNSVTNIQRKNNKQISLKNINYFLRATIKYKP
jgi:hypothetical protein